MKTIHSHHQPRRFWEAKELAEYLGISTFTVARWRKASLIPYIVLPTGGYRYDPLAVEAVLLRLGADER